MYKEDKFGGNVEYGVPVDVWNSWNFERKLRAKEVIMDGGLSPASRLAMLDELIRSTPGFEELNLIGKSLQKRRRVLVDDLLMKDEKAGKFAGWEVWHLEQIYKSTGSALKENARFKKLDHLMIYLWRGKEYVVESAEAEENPEDFVPYSLYSLEEWGHIEGGEFYIDDDGYIAAYNGYYGTIDDLVPTGRKAPPGGFLQG